ncbi:type II secretion system protein [Geomesophilobacter sediminis]|uniref:Type II secretion system protein n=1 Tax=Geomesophilobacter sediminis TaxID=2798584 RepID=A0A8J7JFT0_9BACT|nr:type II secretion system protein [Geomesophilobacter sediminis]MBJ6726456.1 type II secretion system protein [Geomesophilobacter sediminis]
MKTPLRAARRAFRDHIRCRCPLSGGWGLNQRLRSQGGFTYLAALLMMIILGITLSGAVRVWSMQMQREKEEQLLYILSQYRTALRRYYGLDKAGVNPSNITQVPPLNDLKDLTKDPGNAGTVRYLRKSIFAMKDPMTGKDFDIVKDATGIVGIKSKSEAEPIKKGNFPDEFADFEGKTKYSDWLLNCRSNPKPSTGGNVNIPGSTRMPSGTPSQSYDSTGVPGWGAPTGSSTPGVPGWGGGAAAGPASPDAPAGQSLGSPTPAAPGQQ